MVQQLNVRLQDTAMTILAQETETRTASAEHVEHAKTARAGRSSRHTGDRKAVNTTPKKTCFRGAKSVQKMATGKGDDQLIQYDNKLELETSYKLKIGTKMKLGPKVES